MDITNVYKDDCEVITQIKSLENMKAMNYQNGCRRSLYVGYEIS